jgi:hypothetical protein
LSELPLGTSLDETQPPQSLPRRYREEVCHATPQWPYYEFSFIQATYDPERGGEHYWTLQNGAKCTLLNLLQRQNGLHLHPFTQSLRLDDPNLRRFPFLYVVAAGRRGGWRLTDAERKGLKEYLEAGGLLVIDDIWGREELAAFAREMRRVLPGRAIVDLSIGHEVFKSFYGIDEVLQLPGLDAGEEFCRGKRADEIGCQAGGIPHMRGIFDDRGRLLVLINWNTALGNGWEAGDYVSRSNSETYPIEKTLFAYKMGVNIILYALTH